MKKQNLKNLKLNRKSIAVFKNDIKGGLRTNYPCIFKSQATRCDKASNCYCE